jgi:histone H3/H4
MNDGTSAQSAAEKLQEKHDREVELREQDRWLPIANVARLMKNTLPSTAKVSKDAKECMQECVSEFISFITSEASDRCLSEKRKTINGEDILFAMTSLGFENYSEVLKIYLAKYREQQALKQERGENRRPKKQQQANSISIFDQHQQLEREITNIPLHEGGDIDIQNDISNDIMNDIKVDEDDMLNLDVRSDEERNGQESTNGHKDDTEKQGHAQQQVQQQEHGYESVMKTEDDGVLYQYSDQY